MIPVYVVGGKKTYHPECGHNAERFQMGDVTWWLYETFVPQFHKRMFCLYGHSRLTGYVGRGTIRLAGPEGCRVLREGPEPVPDNHGPDVWYAPVVGTLITRMKPEAL